MIRAEYRLRKLEKEESFTEVSIMYERLADRQTWNLPRTPKQCFPTFKSHTGTDFQIIAKKSPQMMTHFH